jgi:hypothetical protein
VLDPPGVTVVLQMASSHGPVKNDFIDLL